MVPWIGPLTSRQFHILDSKLSCVWRPARLRLPFCIQVPSPILSPVCFRCRVQCPQFLLTSKTSDSLPTPMRRPTADMWPRASSVRMAKKS